MKENSIQAMLTKEGNPPFGKLFTAVVALSLPAIIEQIMLTMVQYIDTAMVGSLGASATAAVGLSTSTTWLFNGLINAISIGFSVQVAQYVGARQEDMAKDVVGQAIKFAAIFGVVLGAVGVCLSVPLPSILGADPAIRKDATTYFFIYSFGLPFVMLAALLSALLRCSGDTKTPMVLNILINVINIILNCLFIYPTRAVTVMGQSFTMPGAGLGVAGAAIASAISLALVSMLMLMALKVKKSPIQLDFGKKYHFTLDCLATAWHIGIPMALERTVMSVAQIVLTALITSLGTVAVASNHLGITAESLCYTPGFGISVAATAMIGQAIGAGRKDLAIRFARIITAIGSGLMIFVGLALFFFAPELIMFFTDDPQVIEMGTVLLRIVAVSEPFFGGTIAVTGVLRGAGDSRSPLIINLMTMWGFRVILAFVLKDSMGLAGVWVAMSAQQILTGIIFFAKLISNKWVHLQILNNEK